MRVVEVGMKLIYLADTSKVILFLGLFLLLLMHSTSMFIIFLNFPNFASALS